MSIKENLEKAAALFGDSHEPKCVVMTEESKKKIIGDSFDITTHEFSDGDISMATLANDYLCLHLDGESPYVAHSKKDAIAIAKALGVTADDLT